MSIRLQQNSMRNSYQAKANNTPAFKARVKIDSEAQDALMKQMVDFCNDNPETMVNDSFFGKLKPENFLGNLNKELKKVTEFFDIFGTVRLSLDKTTNRVFVTYKKTQKSELLKNAGDRKLAYVSIDDLLPSKSLGDKDKPQVGFIMATVGDLINYNTGNSNNKYYREASKMLSKLYK